MSKTPNNNQFDEATQARADETADIIAFARVKTIPPGPRPYNPQEYGDFMRVAEMARRNTEEIKRQKAEAEKIVQPLRGSVGAERVEFPRNRAWNQQAKGKKVKIVMGTDVETRPISWAWKDWLAHGKLHIFAGRPGCLKTTTAIGFAAGVTVGGQWPDGTDIAQGNVVVWSGEDAVDDTLLPRFMAAGGDRAHIAFIKGVEEDGKTRAFDPASDMDALAEVCDELGNVNLILVDPVVMIAKGDSHKNAETRRDLQPLADLAERTQAVVIGIHHLTKRSEGANPIDRVSGSLAFGAAPRVILLGALDPKGGAEPRGVLMRAKSNIGPSHGGFSFSAEQRLLDGEPDISAQRILWGDFVDKSASDILEQFEGKVKAAAEKKRKIVEFLTEALAGRGPRMAAEIIAEGEELGFSQGALLRALKKIGGTSEKASFKTGWIWELPEPVQ